MEVQCDPSIFYQYTWLLPEGSRCRFVWGECQGGPKQKHASELVQSHLRKDYHAGVSRDDFELFKAQSLTSLFTCRMPLCPSASIGYDTEAELREHELEHSRKFSCRKKGCHYPPFASSQPLERYINKHHSRARVSRRALRRVGDFNQKLR